MQMKDYVDEICERTGKSGLLVEVEKISLPTGYHDGAVVAPSRAARSGIVGLFPRDFLTCPGGNARRKIPVAL
jgi:hypothetical protein